MVGPQNSPDQGQDPVANLARLVKLVLLDEYRGKLVVLFESVLVDLPENAPISRERRSAQSHRFRKPAQFALRGGQMAGGIERLVVVVAIILGMIMVVVVFEPANCRGGLGREFGRECFEERREAGQQQHDEVSAHDCAMEKLLLCGRDRH